MAGGTADDAARAEMLSAALAPDGMLNLRRLRNFLPAEWADRASVGLDGVIRVSSPVADTTTDAEVDDEAPHEDLSDLEDLPEPVRAQLAALVPALTGQELTGEDAVEALGAAHRVAARIAEARLHAARELTARTAQKSLRLKNVTSPEELSKTARERWRVRSKSVTAAELEALTGMGRGAAREVVAIANAPEICQAPVRQGLAAAIAGWDLVLAWWRRCARLPHEDTAVVARALFSTDIPPEQAAPERLTPEGELSTTPWAKKQFFDALEREVKRLEGTDPAGQEAKRQAQHRSRDAFAIVDDDGTAQLVIKGDVVSITGCVQRLQALAKKARDEGDPRSVAALRSDIARALVTHGTLPLPDLGDDPNFITPDDIQRLVDVLAGNPGVEVQVIVPWDVLTGTAAVVNPCPAPDIHEGQPDWPAPPADDASSPAADDTSAPRVEDASAPAAGVAPARALSAAGPARGPDEADMLDGVGRVLGRFPAFLSGAQARALVGRAGTTLHRLLTDPADGRCLERSVTRYAPDAAMRAQLRAADVMSRAPGTTVPAAQCDLDHVQEYLLGGETSERNLQSLDRPWHALKTEKFWDAVMDASRNVTWESFWGRLYRTRAHDYRQYLTGPRPAVPTPDAAPPGADRLGDPHDGPDRAADLHDGSPPDLTDDEQRHLASLLVYAALAHRPPGARLEADDDDPDGDAAILGLRDAMWIRHTTVGGRRATGPKPGTPSPEQLISHDPHTVLAHPDWTSLSQAEGAIGGDGGEENSGENDRPADDRGDQDGRDGDPSPAPPPPF